MATIIAISNQKGGVAKTTSAVNLASLFAERGEHTLLVDLDSQGNVADSLGLPPGNELVQLLLHNRPVDELAVTSGRPGLDVIRSDKTTVNLKMQLAGVMMREHALAKALARARHDIVLLDCAPSADLLHIAALVAADYLLVPTKLDQLAVKGVRDVLVSLQELRAARISHCELAGIVPTFYERTRRETQLQLEHLVSTFGRYVLPVIPQDAACSEASRAGQLLREYNPRTKALAGLAVERGKLVGGYRQVFDRLGVV